MYNSYMLHLFNSINATKNHFVVEEDPKDDCSKYDGILHIHRPVCCNKKCPGCGGVQGKCAQLTDKEGKILGPSECCGKRIEDSGITCGMNGHQAPCVLPDKNDL